MRVSIIQCQPARCRTRSGSASHFRNSASIAAHVPAKRMGLDTVWVHRRIAKGGFGATPPAEAEPDLEVPDLESLVHALGLRGSEGDRS